MDSTANEELTAPAAAGRSLELSWLSPIGLIGLSFANFVYRLLTLGIYDFWARTEVRKRLWSAIRLNGEPLAYTGTGKELFLGFLIVFGVILLPMLIFMVAVAIAFAPGSLMVELVSLAFYVAIFLLIGVGIYRAQRYRLLRTNWRGIRGSLTGNSLSYGWTYFWTILLIPVTLGWIIPWRTTKLQKMITSHAMFGDRTFSFKGDAGPLYGPFAILWCGALAIFIAGILVLGAVMASLHSTFGPDALTPDGKLKPEAAQVVALAVLAVIAVAYLLYLLISAWYRARTINYFAGCTRFEGAQFKGTATGAGLLWIDMTNILILMVGVVILFIPIVLLVSLIATAAVSLVGQPLESLLGPDYQAQFAAISVPILIVILVLSFTLFLPVTQARSMGYLIGHLSINGPVPLDQIAQSEAAQMSTGEGLAQAFDVDAF